MSEVKFTLTNVLRIIQTFVFLFISYPISNKIFFTIGLFFLFFGLVWLILTEVKIVNEGKYPQTGYLAAFMDLSVFSILKFST